MPALVGGRRLEEGHERPGAVGVPAQVGRDRQVQLGEVGLVVIQRDRVPVLRQAVDLGSHRMQRDQLRVVLTHVDVTGLDQRRDVGQHPVLDERAEPRGVHPEQVRCAAGDELGRDLLLVAAVRDVLDVDLDVRVHLLEHGDRLLIADLLVRVPQRVDQGDRAVGAARAAEPPLGAAGQQRQRDRGDGDPDQGAGRAEREPAEREPPGSWGVHRLIPVSEMDLTMYFWKIANRITIGISATSEAARIRFHWTPKLELKLAVATDRT